MSSLKIEVGDLVHVEGRWRMDGIVMADGRSRHVIRGHLDIMSCIVARKDVTKIIKKKAIDPEMVKYIQG